MASADGGGGGTDVQKLSLCYSKLFQQQAHFAAEQAALFAQIASGDAAALDAVLKMPDPSKVKKEEDGEGGGGKGGKGGKKRKERDPNEPKRPKSGYQLFVIERTPSLRQEKPDKPMRELMSVLADEWKSLSDAQKTKYQSAAVEEKSKYKDKMDAYKASKNGGGEAAAAAAAGGAKAEGEETESDAGGSGAHEHKKKKKHKKKHKHHKKDRSE